MPWLRMANYALNHLPCAGDTIITLNSQLSKLLMVGCIPVIWLAFLIAPYAGGSLVSLFENAEIFTDLEGKERIVKAEF